MYYKIAYHNFSYIRTCYSIKNITVVTVKHNLSKVKPSSWHRPRRKIKNKALRKTWWLHFSNSQLYFPIDTKLCDKVCQWLVAGRWFSPGTLPKSWPPWYKWYIVECGVKHH